MEQNSVTETAGYSGRIYCFANSEIIRLLLSPAPISKIKQDLSNDVASNNELNNIIDHGELILSSCEPNIKAELTMFLSCVNELSKRYKNSSDVLKSAIFTVRGLIGRALIINNGVGAYIYNQWRDGKIIFDCK